MHQTSLRSIGAIVTGMITIIILSIVTDKLLESFGLFPAVENETFIPWMLVVALVYRCIYAVAGGYVTARLAPGQPIKHAIILGIIGIVLSMIGTIVGWNQSAHWYPIALVITSLPCTWLGGRLKPISNPGSSAA